MRYPFTNNKLCFGQVVASKIHFKNKALQCFDNEVLFADILVLGSQLFGSFK
jgi:hypothetical protein